MVESSLTAEHTSIGPRVFRSDASRMAYLAAYDALLKSWPVPCEEQYVPTRLGLTHLIASGAPDAPPLVLFHSAGSGSLQWLPNAAELSRHFRVYAVDTIGEVNKSVPAQKITRRAQFVNWLEDLFDGLAVARADLAGNSFGGFLALLAAMSLPGRVRKTALISPAAGFVPILPFYLRVAFPYKIGYLLHSRRIMLSGFDWINQSFPRDERVRAYHELGKLSGFPSNALPPPVFSDAELRGVRSPVCLLIGDHEVIYRPEDAIRRAARLVPNLQAEIIPHANHNAQVTAPGLVNAKLLKFFLAPEE